MTERIEEVRELRNRCLHIKDQMNGIGPKIDWIDREIGDIFAEAANLVVVTMKKLDAKIIDAQQDE